MKILRPFWCYYGGKWRMAPHYPAPAHRTIKGTAQPSKQFSAWAKRPEYQNQFWGEDIRTRVATQVPHIKHWRVIHGTYEQAPDIEATWFVDPPYSTPAGRHYKHSDLNFQRLGFWCQTCPGQTIVCEQDGADWLPFEPFGTFKANESKSGKKKTKEVIWYAERT